VAAVALERLHGKKRLLDSKATAGFTGMHSSSMKKFALT